MLTQEQILEARKKYGIPEQGLGIQSSAQQKIAELNSAWGKTETPSALSKIGESYKELFTPTIEIGKGALKGARSTIYGARQLGEKLLRGTAGKAVEAITGKTLEKPVYQPEKPEILKPEGGYQKLGYGAEKLAEFLIPATKAAKAEQYVNLLSEGIRTPLLATGARILGKSAIQAGGAGGVSLVQTGGDIKETIKTAATAGIARGVFATIGEGARAIKLPERLYSQIFKGAKTDMIDELKAGGLETLKRNNPVKYQEFLDKGIIKMTKDGKPYLHETLAETALDKGLKGSLKTMSDEVVSKTLESESRAQELVKGFTEKINVSESQFQKVLKTIAKEYEDVGFGEISSEADRLAKILKTNKGMINADDALSLRRFLDRMRIGSSYDKPATKLSLTQSNFKTLSDAVRTRLKDIPGMENLMKDYSFYIDSLENLAREATRRGNAQIISLIDSIFLGGSLGSASPIPGLTMGILRRILLSPWATTNLGQALSRGVLSPVSGAVLESGSSGLQ